MCRAGRKGNIHLLLRTLRYRPRREDTISNNGQTPVEEDVPVPLRERLWFIFVIMCVFPPAGLVLFWRHEEFPPEAKWLVTIVIVGVVVWALLSVGRG